MLQKKKNLRNPLNLTHFLGHFGRVYASKNAWIFGLLKPPVKNTPTEANFLPVNILLKCIFKHDKFLQLWSMPCCYPEFKICHKISSPLWCPVFRLLYCAKVEHVLACFKNHTSVKSFKYSFRYDQCH